MKKLLYLILFITCGAMAQNTTTLPSGTNPFTPSFRYKAATPDSLNQFWIFNPTTGKYNRGVNFTEFNSYVGTATAAAIAASTPINPSFTILQQAQIGAVIPSGTSYQQNIAIYAPPQPPFVTFAGTLNLQYKGAGSTTSSISYAYGKNAGTSNILDAKVNGSTTGITQSSTGASGSISETYTNNANTSYTMVVRTVDSPPLSASQTYNINWYPFYYVGTCAGTTPTSSEVLAATTSGISTGTDYNMNFTFTGSNLHVFYAYYNAYPTVTSVKDAAGNQAIGAMTLSTVAITDNGFSGTWKTVTTNNTYTNANIVLTIRQ